MNYQEFRCEFLERMKEVMEEGVSITTEKINKNKRGRYGRSCIKK